ERGRRPRAEHVALAFVHETRFHRIAIVVPDEMEHAVRHEQLELCRQRDPDATRLSRRRGDRDHDLAHERSAPRHLHGKGEAVRPALDPAPRCVEAANLRILDEEDLDVAARAAQRRQRALSGAGDATCYGDAATMTTDDDARHYAPPGLPSRPRASCAS